ncbi:MAG: hypothetical protein K2X11_07895 [Acetobacteraceae bacterium]|nr:hypothetical protein [Acetobacteraceae bacterium]
MPERPTLGRRLAFAGGAASFRSARVRPPGMAGPAARARRVHQVAGGALMAIIGVATGETTRLALPTFPFLVRLG